MLEQGLARYLSEEQRAKLASVRVGVAGAGGLGSNVALMLARCGVRHFVLVDGDTVDASNLNRQQFFPRHVGMPKVAALGELLRELNPAVLVECRQEWLDAQSIRSLFAQADIWVEALDEVRIKRDFVEIALQADKFVVSASGIAGWGGAPMQKRDFGGKLILVGDFVTGIDVQPPLAPRVMQAAALQADAVLEYVLGPCTFDGGFVPHADTEGSTLA